MRRVIITRIAWMVVVLFVLSFVVFSIQRTLPSDPVRIFFGRNASKELIAQKRHELGYDRSFFSQYGLFVNRLFHGNLGDSLRTRRPVVSDLADFLPGTLELAGVASLLALLLALIIALSSALRRRGGAVVRVIAIVFSSAPTFLLGLGAVLLFYRHFHWLPAGGRTKSATEGNGWVLLRSVFTFSPSKTWDAIRHLIMPALALALAPGVAIGRTLRGSLLDVLEQEHIRTVRAGGLSERLIVLRHALRNALLPAISMGGLQLGLLLSGVVVVEVVFAWPGLGLYLNQAIRLADFPAVIGVVLVLGVVFVVTSALVDLLQAVADPRLRGRS
jgi:peptide/nickel transport system permease protein